MNKLTSKLNWQFYFSGRIFEKASCCSISPKSFFHMAKKAGFDGVDLRKSQISPESQQKEIKLFKVLSEQNNLPVQMLTLRDCQLDSDADMDRFKAYLDLAEALRCELIKVSGNNFSILQRAAEMAAERGIKIGSNNHVGTLLETCEGTLDFLQQVKHKNFYLLFDPSHLWLNREVVDKKFIDLILARTALIVFQDYIEIQENEPGMNIGKRKVIFANACQSGQVGYRQISKHIATEKGRIKWLLFQPDYVNSSLIAKAWKTRICDFLI